MKYQIDDIDRKILSYLVKNARIPFLEIARECGISGAAIHQRVKKMEDAEIIEGSRFIVKPRALGLKICAFTTSFSIIWSKAMNDSVLAIPGMFCRVFTNTSIKC